MIGFTYELIATYADQAIESFFARDLHPLVARYAGGILCACITQLGISTR